VQVVRCFEDVDIHHVTGTVDPVRDIEIITTELVLADLESVEKRIDRQSKQAKRGDKEAIAEMPVLQKMLPVLEQRQAGDARRAHDRGEGDREALPAADRQADDLRLQREGHELATADQNPYVQKVRDYAKTHLACEAVVISAQIESDLVDLEPADAKAFLKDLGVRNRASAR
jgi:ribosome-binding ATPase YchF (GTP1/OBG family)